MKKQLVSVCLGLLGGAAAVTTAALWGCGGDSSAPVNPGLPGGTATRQQVLQGRYLVTSIGCSDCHSAGDPNPAAPNWLAGYRPNPASQGKFVIGAPPNPITVYAANLTPDVQTGLGGWQPQQIFNALRNGKDKDGNTLCPPMPWPSFRNLTDSDIWAIVAYLQNIKAVSNNVPEATSPNTPAGQHPDCSIFYQGLQPLPPYPAANEVSTTSR